MSEETIAPETWRVLISTCQNCKWLVLLEHLMQQQNQPQDLEILDHMLKETILDSAGIMYPSSNAITSLNAYLGRSLIPYRIKQITQDEKNRYRGTIQVRYHRSPKS